MSRVAVSILFISLSLTPKPQSPGKQFMHGYDRTIVPPDLLFSQREIRDERDIEVFFDHEGI